LEDLGLVHDLAVVWLMALVVGTICVRLRFPVIAGYILAGVVIGPFGLRLIHEIEQIKVLAELGVALLLFALGVELSIRKVFASAGRATISGLLQIVVTTAVAWLLVAAFHLVPNWSSGLIFGFVCALSSTAVVTKLLVDRVETETLHGRTIVPILLIQDLALVPFVALMPALEQVDGSSMWVLGFAFLKAAFLIVIIVVGAIHVVPRILAAVSKSNSRELFLLMIISLCLVVALLSKELGVSLALGAFLSGIMVSERPYGHQVLSEIMPLRDLFATLFFVSIGMLLNPVFIMSHWSQVLLFVVLLVVGKALVTAASAFVATRSIWSALLVGLGLAQIGEFSFVLATLAHAGGLLPEDLYNLFFAGAVVTLAISPMVIVNVPMLLAKIPRFRLIRASEHAEVPTKVGLKEHIVLCGFGRMGRSLGLTLQSRGIPVVVVEINGELAEELEEAGIRYVFGDAFSHFVLSKANLKQAACIVVTVPDPVVALQITMFARKENKNLGIVVRANKVDDIEMFKQAGATAVVQPEFEASIEAMKHTLSHIGHSREEILQATRDIKQRGHRMYQSEAENEPFVEFPHEDYFGTWFSYRDVKAVTLAELHVRKQTGATILAVRRDEKVIPHPDGSLTIKPGDELYVTGDGHQLEKFEHAYSVSRFCPMEVGSSDSVAPEPAEV